MKKYTILIDVDDTIENLVEEWCKYLNEKYGTSVSHNDISDWDIRQFFPDLTPDQVYEPLHTEDIWYRLSPKDEAVEYVKRLIEDGHDIYLCTSTNYRNVKSKYEGVVQRLFPYIDWERVIVTYNKQMLKADFLIDDYINNLVGGDYKKILMDAPHNRSIDLKGTDIFRAKNWKEIYEYIVQQGSI